MAKIYCFTRHKLCRELKELKEFVENKYKYSRDVSAMWFDHYAVTNAQMRIREIHRILEGLGSDTADSKEDSDTKADE